MTTYAIGDVQGCFDELCRLLRRVNFDTRHDRLLFTGDLVNRGPKSLEVLRFVRDLGDRAVVVLGNHDLHLVAAALAGHARPRDTFNDVLSAPDRHELIDWLRRQPLVYQDTVTGLWLVHAGLPPQWDTALAHRLSEEASALLAGPAGDEFLSRHMYGDEPDRWDDSLQGWDRLRFVINCCTRLRYCTADGRVELGHKYGPGTQPDGLHPWFALPDRKSRNDTIIFGHWSTLGRVKWPRHKVIGMDTGCVWGGRLTALRLSDRRLFSISSPVYSKVD